MRRLIISTEAPDTASRSSLIESLQSSEVLKRHGLKAREISESELEVRGEGINLSDHDIEAIASTFTHIANRSSCVFEFEAVPGQGVDGALCTLHPGNEMDGKVVRAFLWELFGEA